MDRRSSPSERRSAAWAISVIGESLGKPTRSFSVGIMIAFSSPDHATLCRFAQTVKLIVQYALLLALGNKGLRVRPCPYQIQLRANWRISERRFKQPEPPIQAIHRQLQPARRRKIVRELAQEVPNRLKGTSIRVCALAKLGGKPRVLWAPYGGFGHGAGAISSSSLQAAPWVQRTVLLAALN
jgi:hypothetical protein